MAKYLAKLKTEKQVCWNCYHYSRYNDEGFCACREQADMIRVANHCPDWCVKELK